MVAKKSKYKSVVNQEETILLSIKLRGSILRVIRGMRQLMTALGLQPSVMITHAYLFDQDKKNIWTFR